MKQSGRCPKCDGFDIQVGRRGTYAAVGMSRSQSVPTEVYACGDCGFAEEHVLWDAENDMSNVAVAVIVPLVVGLVTAMCLIFS